MRISTAVILAAVLIVRLAMPAAAQQQNATGQKEASPPAQHKLTVAVGGAFTSMDPHYHNLGPNNALTGYVFEPLIRFNPKFQPEPG